MPTPKAAPKTNISNIFLKIMQIILKYANDGKHKYVVLVENKKIYFGDINYEDYTIHKNKERKSRYTQRHKSNENWNKSGIKTAGFWSKWLLWNKPSISASIRDIEKRFDVKIRKKN